MNDAPAVQENLNPFANAPVVARPGGTEVSTASASAREVAEVQGAMVMARRFPRVEVEVMDKILQACTRPTLAEGALYEYSRGGSDIRGPSIRLAECIAQYWGHLDFGWRVLEERPGATKVQTFAWDMQTGARSQVVFDIVHEVGLRGGGRKQLHDPRDIYEHVANNASRRLRACILRVVPGDVVEAAVKQCEKTLQLKVEVTADRLASMVAQFAELGVPKAAIEKRIQRRLEAMTPGIMVQLGKIYTSLRDSMSQPADWFDLGTGTAPEAGQDGPGGAGAPRPGNPRQQVRERIQARRDAATPPPAAAPTPPPAPAPGQGASQALEDIVRFCRAAATADDLERVRTIALQLTDEDEVLIAQQHIKAATGRMQQ